MENEEIIERAKESVRKHYNCNGEYPCHNSGDCEMCRGYNTPYDCCECGAGDYIEGYIAGAIDQRKIDEIHKAETTHAIKGNLTNKEFRLMLEQMPDDACICIECCNPRKMVYDKENNLIRID